MKRQQVGAVDAASAERGVSLVIRLGPGRGARGENGHDLGRGGYRSGDDETPTHRRIYRRGPAAAGALEEANQAPSRTGSQRCGTWSAMGRRGPIGGVQPARVQRGWAAPAALSLEPVPRGGALPDRGRVGPGEGGHPAPLATPA